LFVEISRRRIEAIVERPIAPDIITAKVQEAGKDFEQQALSLYERATEVDDKWRVRLESKRKVAIQKSNSSQN
jgi:hypothetical protein